MRILYLVTELLHDASYMKFYTLCYFSVLIAITAELSAQWYELHDFTENGFSNLWFFDESEGILLQRNKIYRTEDGGTEWELVESFPTNWFFWDMDFHGDTGLIVGSMSDDQGLYSTDRGQSWAALLPPGISYRFVSLISGTAYYKSPVVDPHLAFCDLLGGICSDTLLGADVIRPGDIETIGEV